MVVFIILGGILSGAFTATESAAIAVGWALLITVLVYRSLSWTHFLKACAKACKTTGVVLLLIGISAAFGYFLALYEVPQRTGELMKAVSTEPWVIFLMINVLLFVLGTFLDMAPTILICTPIFLPIAQQFGMDPLQFGIVMLINCALGLNTPPVGTVQFVGCAIGEMIGGPGDAFDRAVLWRAGPVPAVGDLCAGVFHLAAADGDGQMNPMTSPTSLHHGPAVAFTPLGTHARPGGAEWLHPSFAATVRVASATVEQIATGCRWAEGPVWFGDHRCLLWSDIPNNRILRWDGASGLVSVFRAPAQHANGLARDAQGRLVAASI